MSSPAARAGNEQRKSEVNFRYRQSTGDFKSDVNGGYGFAAGTRANPALARNMKYEANFVFGIGRQRPIWNQALAPDLERAAAKERQQRRPISAGNLPEQTTGRASDKAAKATGEPKSDKNVTRYNRPCPSLRYLSCNVRS